jgi:hypothetical protein
MTDWAIDGGFAGVLARADGRRGLVDGIALSVPSAR